MLREEEEEAGLLRRQHGVDSDVEDFDFDFDSQVVDESRRAICEKDVIDISANSRQRM